VIHNGSVAVDGIGLTVAALESSVLTFSEPLKHRNSKIGVDPRSSAADLI
jgi:riboflavin synthase alpha subunit